MFYTYVLRLYIGYSANLKKRLREHEEGVAFATSYRGPWKLIYYEAYVEQADAEGREHFLKSGSGRRLLRRQLVHYFENNPLRITKTTRSSTPQRQITD